MKKLNLNKKILNIKGEPLKTEKPVLGTIDRVISEIRQYSVGDHDVLAERFKSWQEDLKKTEKKEMVLRDYLLIMLGSRFTMEDRKEAFWTTQLGILISDEENDEIEIPDNQFAFLKRIMENNKIQQASPTGGTKEIEVFFPYELGQVMEAFEDKEEEKPKPKKKKE